MSIADLKRVKADSFLHTGLQPDWPFGRSVQRSVELRLVTGIEPAGPDGLQIKGLVLNRRASLVAPFR